MRDTKPPATARPANAASVSAHGVRRFVMMKRTMRLQMWRDG